MRAVVATMNLHSNRVHGGIVRVEGCMAEIQERVKRWRLFMGLPCNDKPQVPLIDARVLHANLLKEELQETIVALAAGDIPKIADGIADLMVVALGLACEAGIQMGPIFDAVMFSNMSKTPGLRDSDGKLSKGPNYIPPPIKPALERQGWRE